MANNFYNQGNTVSLSTQKILFAEDLVNYILIKNYLPTMLFSTERQRKECVSILDNSLKMAADFLINTVGRKINQTFQYILKNNLYNIAWFNSYAKALKDNFITLDVYTEDFFHYAVHLAHLAAKLYARGFREAPRMTVHFIIEAMDIDLFNSRIEIFTQRFVHKPRQSTDHLEKPPPRTISKTIRREQRTRGKASKCREVQPHVDNKTAFKNGNMNKNTPTNLSSSSFQPHVDNKTAFNNGNMNQDTPTNSSSSSFQPHVDNNTAFKNGNMNKDTPTSSSSSSFQSQSCSDIEEKKTFLLVIPTMNLSNVSSSGFISVPGASYQVPTNLYPEEWYFTDPNTDGNGQRKKPRLILPRKGGENDQISS